MSRFIISNDAEVYSKLLNANIRSGLAVSHEGSMNGIYFASFKRRVKENISFYGNDDSHFVMSSGTFIYNESTDEKGLKELLFDFRDVSSCRDRLIGNYAIAVADGHNINIFSDKYGIYDIFYYKKEHLFVISTSLSELACVIPEVSINRAALFSETILAGYIGNETLFDNVYKLRGVEQLIVNNDGLSVKVLPYTCKRWDFSGQTIEAAVTQYVSMIECYTKKISALWGHNIAIHQTGGMDNRLILSALINAGQKPTLLYGQGNSILTTTDKEDRNCVLDYAKKFSLDAHIMDWSHSEGERGQNMWGHHFQKYGFKFAMYGAPTAFFEEYEGKIPRYPDFFEYGYYGENLRLREYLQGREQVTFDEFFDEYLFGGGGGYGIINDTAFLPDADSIMKKLKADFINEARLFGVEISSIIKAENFDRLRWLHARQADSRSVNFINEFASSFALLSTPELHEFPWSLPAEWRKNGEFQLRVIRELCSDALDIPIFSHGKLQTIDKETAQLKIRYSFAEQVKHFLEKINIDEKIIRKVANIYHNCFQFDREKVSYIKSNAATCSKAEDWVVSYLKHDAPPSLKYVDPTVYKGHVVGLYRYALHVYALDKFLDIKGS